LQKKDSQYVTERTLTWNQGTLGLLTTMESACELNYLFASVQYVPRHIMWKLSRGRRRTSVAPRKFRTASTRNMAPHAAIAGAVPLEDGISTRRIYFEVAILDLPKP
jgi:hypothetical protein